MEGKAEQTGAQGNEQLIVENLKRKISSATADAQTLKNEFNKIKPNADKAEEEINKRYLEAIDKQNDQPLKEPFPGTVGDGGSPKHHVRVTDIYVKEVLKAYKANPNLIAQPPGSIGREVLEGLARNIESPDIEINLLDSPYLYNKIIYPAINGNLNDLNSLTTAFNEASILRQSNSPLFEKISRIFVSVAERNGLSSDEAEQRFGTKNRSESVGGLRDYSEQILYKKLDKKEKEYFNSLDSAESFRKYCQEQTEDIKAYDVVYKQATSEEKEEILKMRLSDRIKQRNVSIVFRIYDHILHERKDEAIEHKENEGGIYNSVTMLYSSFRQRIEALIADVGKSDLGINFVQPKRKEVQTYDPEKKQFVREYRILPDYETLQSREFLESLMRVNESERSRIRYGYNLEYIHRAGPGGAYDIEKGLFPTISGYATNLRSDQIDEIFAEDTGEIVQRAIGFFDQRNEKFMAMSGWKSDPQHVDEFFSYIDKMKEHVEFYIKDLYKGQYEDWMLERAIFNAKLIIYGMYFKPILWYSYADPKMTSEGVATYRGEGEQNLATFDPGHNAKKFQGDEPGKNIGHEFATKGVDFLPMNFIIEKYGYKVWKEWNKRWMRTNTEGQAAYWDLAGEDSFGIRLFIDIGNICGAGGFDTLSGWRTFPAYKDWIRENIDIGENLLYAKNDLVMTEAWKRLENIGIDALENFAEKFIGQNIPAKGKILEDKGKLNNMLNLYGYFFDRYLEKGLGRDFLKGENGTVIGRNEFIKRIEVLLTSKDVSKQTRVEELRGWLYKSLSVVMFERLPMKYVFLEKQRFTQNGITLLSELMDFAGEQHWQVEGAGNQFEQALDDLILAQTELRASVSNDMDKIFDSPDDNLFGDLTKNRSKVNNGKGYVLDEVGTREILGKMGATKNDGDRIERAVKMYTELKRLVLEKPARASWEKDKDKLETAAQMRASDKFTNRLGWFYDMYRGDNETKVNKFGFSPTSGELALKFISISASGPDTIKRAANWSAKTGEALNKYWGGMLKALREARTNRDVFKMYPALLELYGFIEGETGAGAVPNKVILKLVDKSGLFFRKSDVSIPGTGFFVNLKDWAFRKPSSFSEEDAGEPGKLDAWEMDANDRTKLINQFEGDLGRSLIAEKPEEPLMKKVSLERYGLLGKIYKKLSGKRYLEVRDYANEISGQAGKRFLGTGPLKFFSEIIMPKILLLFLIISLILGWQSFKKYFTFGGQKN